MINLLTFIVSLWAANAENLVLYPGFQHSVSLGQGHLSVEHKGIVDIRDRGSRLHVIGKKIGSTQISSATKTIDIHVLSKRNYQTYAKLMAWTGGKVGPRVVITEGQPTLTGKLLLLEDWLELREIMDSNDIYVSRFKVDALLDSKIRKELASILSQHQLPFSDLVTEGVWTLYLGKKQKADLADYKKVLNPLGIQVGSSPFVVSGIPMVEINIVAAEVNKKNMSQIGVQWPGSTVAQPFADQIIAKDSWSVTIHHLEQNGWGKVLASPTLITQSGEEATFHSGGEIPIRTATQFNTNVQWKKYGIMLKIKPLVDFKGNIDVLIECEVSMIDGSTVVDGAPGLLINRITSHFNLQENRTIALSGLIKEEWAKGRTGLPAIKDIPILGQLFGSDNYLNNRSELLFFVTPKIVH